MKRDPRSLFFEIGASSSLFLPRMLVFRSIMEVTLKILMFISSFGAMGVQISVKSLSSIAMSKTRNGRRYLVQKILPNLLRMLSNLQDFLVFMTKIQTPDRTTLFRRCNNLGLQFLLIFNGLLMPTLVAPEGVMRRRDIRIFKISNSTPPRATKPNI